MKEYKVLHVQEEHPRKLTEANWHFAYDYPWVEQVLKLYAEAGYLTLQMAPDIFPDHSEDRPHHLHGYTFLLEREASKLNRKITPAHVDEINALTNADYPYLEARRLDLAQDPFLRNLFRPWDDPNAPRDYHDLEVERLKLERDLDIEDFFKLSESEDHTP